LSLGTVTLGTTLACRGRVGPPTWPLHPQYGN
jgi:hypothetical protein